MTEVSENTTPRGEVLMEAKSLIEGDRNKTYGSPTENFQNTAELWTTLLKHKLKPGEVVQPYEVATLMVALKLARTIAQPKRDNFVDIAGYAACAYETILELILSSEDTDEAAINPNPLWTGSYGDDEPPPHVIRLRAIEGPDDGVLSSSRLVRCVDGTWTWVQIDEISDAQLTNVLLTGGGFRWQNIGRLSTVPDYVFEEDR